MPLGPVKLFSRRRASNRSNYTPPPVHTRPGPLLTFPGNTSVSGAPGTRIEVKRLDKVYNGRNWEVREPYEVYVPSGKARYAPYAEYVIILRRKVEMLRNSDISKITTKVLVQSESLVGVFGDVFDGVRNLSWNTRPFKITPELLLAYLPRLKSHLKDLSQDPTVSRYQETTDHLSFLISFLEEEYESTLSKISTLLCNNEISFELIWAIMLPRSILFTSCDLTSEPRAVRLLEVGQLIDRNGDPYWNLLCEYVNGPWGDKFPEKPFELVKLELKIEKFEGVVDISQLVAYPLERHPSVDVIREKLLIRGQRWLGLDGFHHVRYSGVAYTNPDFAVNHTKVNVNGRIIIDRRMFAHVKPNYNRWPSHHRNLINHPLATANSDSLPQITDGIPSTDKEHILLTTPILYGFSLVDNRWLEFNVEHVTPIKWNNEVFDNLVIDPHRKLLVRSLVGSHMEEESIDDFIEGKGLGLVFNLWGPPGVGKSLTVEAISEHLHKPLYVVGAGDLGTEPSTLDSKLTDIFNVAAKWKAVVLIDEADVFLEERSTAKLERNSMVAVFLRQIEYFSGILFLTTNRVKTFDPAFQSRIHLSLKYTDLSDSAKEEIWRGFLSKVGNTALGAEDITAGQMQELANLDLNGRQIKNVVKVAVSLANDEKQPLDMAHLREAVKVVVGNGV